MEVLESLANLFRPNRCLAQRAFWQDERKFFAAIAASDIFRAHRAQESLADRSQNLIPSRVSELVVITFEVIEVEHKHGQGAAFPAGGMQFVIQKLLHVAAIVKTRERVADCFQAERFTQTETGDGNRDMFGDGRSELATAGWGARVGIDFRVRSQNVVVLQ
jgi:hypothetical protein